MTKSGVITAAMAVAAVGVNAFLFQVFYGRLADFTSGLQAYIKIVLVPGVSM